MALCFSRSSNESACLLASRVAARLRAIIESQVYTTLWKQNVCNEEKPLLASYAQTQADVCDEENVGKGDARRRFEEEFHPVVDGIGTEQAGADPG